VLANNVLHFRLDLTSGWVPQVLQEVKWLNAACRIEIPALEKQLLDIGKLIDERIGKIEKSAAPAGDGFSFQTVESDSQLQTLKKEQKSIESRSDHPQSPPPFLNLNLLLT
jgi:hypothetical protein